MILDILLLALFALCVFIGFKKGFAKSVYSTASAIGSAFLGTVFGGMIGNAILNSAVFSSVSDRISEALNKVTLETSVGSDASKLISEVPESFESFLRRFNINIGSLREAFGETSVGISDLSQKVASDVASGVARAIGWLLVFIVCIIVFRLIRNAVLTLFKIPVVKQVNSLLGVGLGAVNGIIWVLVACVALTIVTIYDIGGLYESTKLLTSGSFLYRLFVWLF